jgi:hypothetical protein
MVRVKLSEERKELNTIKEWIDQQSLPHDITTHYWFSALPDTVRMDSSD